MSVTVRFFALLRERQRCDRVELDDAAGKTVGQIFAALFPDLADDPLRSSLAFARNGEYVDEEQAVEEGDELAFIPPLGGGAPDPRVSLASAPLQLDPLIELVTSPGRGGLATFTGLVRDHFEGRPVTQLEYEAYEPMALTQMARLCDEIETTWEGCAVAMHHRLGKLAIGEVAVHIAVAAPHRDAAFAACRFGIDELKERVPIFKKEIYRDGSQWKGNTNV
jgi:molybdopterin synthase catalytic subunit/molybdopterin converting factor small subunit